MVIRRPKKNLRQRGSRQHGWGRTSGGHRPSGTRGGKGAAGKYDQHFLYYKKLGVLGINNRGFFPHRGPRSKTTYVMNVGQLDSTVEKLATEKLVEKSSKGFSVDLANFGITKLLGSGKVTHILNIKVNSASESAQEKVATAGGKVEITGASATEE